LYPYYAVHGFPEWNSIGLWILIFFEGVFGVDMILKFFLQGMDEIGQSLNQPIETIAENYFKKEFFIDLIIILPFGLLSRLDHRLEFLWFIKDIRIKDVSFYLSK